MLSRKTFSGFDFNSQKKNEKNELSNLRRNATFSFFFDVLVQFYTFFFSKIETLTIDLDIKALFGGRF